MLLAPRCLTFLLVSGHLSFILAFQVTASFHLFTVQHFFIVIFYLPCSYVRLVLLWMLCDYSFVVLFCSPHLIISQNASFLFLYPAPFLSLHLTCLHYRAKISPLYAPSPCKDEQPDWTLGWSQVVGILSAWMISIIFLASKYSFIL